jgi:hypothetical protein
LDVFAIFVCLSIINQFPVAGAIIKIRWKQIARQLEGIGIFRFLFLTGLAVFLFYIVFKQLGIESNHYFVTVGFILLVLSVHLQRTDKEFLKIIKTHPVKVYFSEYLLLSVPLISGLIYYRLWTDILILLSLISVTGFIDFTPRTTNRHNRFIRLIPDDSYEWKSGVRKGFVGIILILIAGIGGNFLFEAAIPIAILVLSLFVINFYQTGEPEIFLIIKETGVKQFLKRKIIEFIIQFTMLVSPLILLFILFYPGFWFIPFVELLMIYFVFIYVVLLKYAFYIPNEKLISSQTLSAIGTLSLLLPFMLPVTWLLSVRFYYKSLSNLKPFLYDFD